MNIVFYETSGEDQASLQSLCTQSEGLTSASVTFIPEKLNSQNITQAQNAEVVGVFINSELRKQQIDALPNLKLITTLSTGFDHIDVAYAKQKGITVTNVPSYGSRTVAEFTFALMLGLSRK